MLRNEDTKQPTAARQAYTRPTLVARGDIMDVTKGGGLLPGDTSLTLVDPGQAS